MTPNRLFHRVLSRERMAGATGMAPIVTVVAIGSFFLLISSGALSGGSRPSQTPSCAIQDGAFLPVASYGDFVKSRDSSGRLAPDRFNPGVSGESRVQGFFAALALEPRYRAENEAIRRSWGYEPLPDRPGLPLSGSIVLDNPGLLEIYQEVSSFTTEEIAVDWMTGAGSGNKDELITPKEIDLLDVDDVIVRQIEPTEPQYPTRLGVTMRLGNLGIGLGLLGGAEVTFDRMLPLVQDALSRVRAECAVGQDESIDTVGVE